MTRSRSRELGTDRARGLGIEADPRFTDVALLHADERTALYEARQAATGRRVSVKLARSDAPWAGEAIQQEARILGQLGHPNVMSLHEQVRMKDGRLALVLERSAGSLGDLTGAYHPGVPLAVSMGVKLCGALETLHLHGYLHTNVCPRNIHVTEAGELILANFDEAVEQGAAANFALHTATAWTAPELLEGGAPSPATDVYGLAVTLYEVLAGHPAFPAYDGEPESETSLRILRGVHAPLPPTVPLPLADCITWAMTVEPGQRPPSAAWLAEELRRVEQGQHWPRTRLLAGSTAP